MRGLARELREGGGVDAVYEHLVPVRLPLAAAEAQEVAVVQAERLELHVTLRDERHLVDEPDRAR